MIRLEDDARYARLMRAATAGAVAYCITFAVMEVLLITTLWAGGTSEGIWATLATLGYLPLHVRHVWFGARGVRPPLGGLSLAVMAVVILAAIAPVGTVWLSALNALAVSTLIVLGRPLAMSISIAVLAVPFVVPVWAGEGWVSALYHGTLVIWRASALFVLVWLAAAARAVHSTRAELVLEAVTRQRRAMEGELDDKLGEALKSVATLAERSNAAAIDQHEEALGRSLHDLVETSRGTLAQARRVIASMQQVSLHGELETAASVLTAAGIPTTIAIEPPVVLDRAEDRLRHQLREGTAALLRQRDLPGACLIRVSEHAGELSLSIETEHVPRSVGERQP